MSSVFYAERLYWDSHTNRGCAKHHGHEMRIDRAPCICGEQCDVDFTPEVSVGRIRHKREGWTDMTGEEIRDAMRLLNDLIPEI